MDSSKPNQNFGSNFKAYLIIGFDGKRAAGNFTGLGNYSRYLIEILSAFYPENKYLIYSPKRFAETISTTLEKIKSVSIHYPKNRLFKSWWRSFEISEDLKTDQVQIYHGLSNEIPIGLKKAKIFSVVTVHDLIFLRFPEFYSFFDRAIYNLKFRYACKNAVKIIAISEQTKRDIVHFFQIPESRIKVIYQNCSKVFRQSISEDNLKAIRIKYALPEKYLLNVGTIETRKNLLLIVKTLATIDSSVHLVVIGKETSYTAQVKAFIANKCLENRIHFLKNVLQDDLPGIYRQAEIFVFPSRFEGFGIPILEALHSRIPVIAASGSCLEEAGGPESIYVNPDDEEGLKNAINSILTTPEKRQHMIEAGTEYIKRFSDELIAAKIMEVYHNLKHNA